jgi:trimeric autotransporter adhesin
MASKSYRKFMATGLSAAVVASVVAPVASAAYDDVKPGAWYEEAINYVTEAGYMQGTGKGFEPGKNMTRAEAAQLFTNILGLETEGLEANFSDVQKGAWYYEEVAAVNEYGVMKGSGSKFEPKGTLTRGQMAAIIVRAYGFEGHEGRDHSFTDIEGNMFETEIAILADLGIVDGMGDGKFNPGAPVTRAQMAAFIMKTEVGDEIGLPVVTAVEAVDTKTVEVTVEGAWTQEQVDALVEAGYELTVEGKESHTVGKVTVKAAEATASEDTTTLVLSEIAPELVAGEELSLAVNGEKVEGSDFKIEVPATPEVTSVSAINSKTLKVEFNKAVDKDKATVEVKKGSVTASVSKVTFAEDMKSATVELGSKLTKGTYTVNVKGLADTALTGSVDVEDEKVTGIEILSDVAPLYDGADLDTVKDDASVAYKVVNQYGEDITRFTSISATASKGTASVDSVNGKITIDSGTGALEKDDKVTLTLIHASTAVTSVKTITVSSESKVAEVSLGEIYNKDGKLLNEDTDLATDRFYIPVTATNQYGQAVTNLTQLASDLIINETNNTIVDVANSFTEITIDGKKVPALQVNAPGAGIKVGETTLTLISNTTGKNASAKITVSEAVRADVVNMSQPEWVVVDEDALIPVQVTDKQGNLVTDLKTLNSTAKGVKVTVGNANLTESIVLKDGATYVKVPAANLTSEGAIAVVAVSSSNKVNTLTLNVRAKAVPTVITGLKSDFSKTVAASDTKDIGVGNLVIEDQYGRTMSAAKVNAWLDAHADNKIVITEDEAVTSAVSISDTAGDNDIAASGETVTVTAGAANGSEKLTFVLETTAGAVQGSSSEAALRVTDGTEYKSYEVKTIGTVYDEAGASKTDNVAYDKEVVVYGVLNDGSKVKLTSGYTVTSTNTTVATDVADSVIDQTVALTYGTDLTEKVVPVTVTINATGEQFTQDVTFSKVAPKVASVKVIDGTDVDADAEAVIEHDISAGGDFTIADLQTVAGYNLVVTDQYGVSTLTTAGAVAFADTTTVAAPTLTITPVEGEITITSNGLAGATVAAADLADKEAFNVVVKYTGGATATFKVVAKP